MVFQTRMPQTELGKMSDILLLRVFCCVAVVFVFLFFVHTSRATEKQEAVLLICLILITTNGNYKDNDNGYIMEQVPKSGNAFSVSPCYVVFHHAVSDTNSKYSWQWVVTEE